VLDETDATERERAFGIPADAFDHEALQLAASATPESRGSLSESFRLYYDDQDNNKEDQSDEDCHEEAEGNELIEARC